MDVNYIHVENGKNANIVARIYIVILVLLCTFYTLNGSVLLKRCIKLHLNFYPHFLTKWMQMVCYR